MKLFGISLIFFSISFQACSSQQQNFKTGLTDSIKCKFSPEQMYSAYIPDSCDFTLNIPAFFLFDPAARAKQSVELYKELANKYHVALFCSYNSKNGPVDQNKKAADAMIADALERFPIDETKLYISGFSGGSRFSYIYATQNTKIKGVIACGAFYPGNSSNLSKPSFTYSGIAGTYDFNFSEGLSMRNQLIGQNFPFQFITFNGTHEWPPVEYFERALVFQLSRNAEFQSLEFLCGTLEQKALQSSIDSNDFINASWIYQNLMICNKSRQMEFYDSLQSVLNSKIYQQHSKSFSKSLRLEDSITSEFSEATSGILMTTYNQYDTHKPMLWWKQKINSISKMEENPKDIYKRNAAKRIKGQIGVMLWETNRRLMQEKYYNQSLELADILLLLDPESATYMALKSEVLAAQGKTTEAKEVFNEAKNKGFTFDNAFLGKSQILKQLDEN